MAQNIQKISSHLACLVMGIILTFAVMPILNLFNGLAFGFEICSRASFPRTHMAKVRTRPGGGDQTLFLEVDGKEVWRSGDMPPGDLDEELSWDTTGRIVTLKLQGEPFLSYDTVSKSKVEKED